MRRFVVSEGHGLSVRSLNTLGVLILVKVVLLRSVQRIV